MALPSHLVSSSTYVVVVPLFFSVNFLFIHCVVVVSHVRIRVNNSLSSLSSTTSLIKTSVFTPSLAFLLLCHWFRSSFVQLKTRHCSIKTSLTNKTLNKKAWTAAVKACVLSKSLRKVLASFTLVFLKKSLWRLRPFYEVCQHHLWQQPPFMKWPQFPSMRREDTHLNRPDQARYWYSIHSTVPFWSAYSAFFL